MPDFCLAACKRDVRVHADGELALVARLLKRGVDIVGEQRKRLLLRHGALVRLDAAHAPLARVVEIVEQKLVKAHLCRIP